jgi:hypothetical protein
MSKVLLIDYENVQKINLTEIEGMDLRVSVFTGNSQNKIPIDLVSSAQALGERLSWVRIDGNGPNALDFHIAYYLGVYAAKNPMDEYLILSRDKGFDPLIKHLAREKVICKRIGSISEIGPVKRVKGPDGDYGKVVANLKKIEKGQRPRSKKTLRQHIKSLVGKAQSEEKLDQLIDRLFGSKQIVEEHGRITYKI